MNIGVNDGVKGSREQLCRETATAWPIPQLLVAAVGVMAGLGWLCARREEGGVSAAWSGGWGGGLWW